MKKLATRWPAPLRAPAPQWAVERHAVRWAAAAWPAFTLAWRRGA